MFGFFGGREKWFVGLVFSLLSAEMDLYVPVKVFSIETGNKEVADLPGCFVTSGLSFCVSCAEDNEKLCEAHSKDSISA